VSAVVEMDGKLPPASMNLGKFRQPSPHLAMHTIERTVAYIQALTNDVQRWLQPAVTAFEQCDI